MKLKDNLSFYINLDNRYDLHKYNMSELTKDDF